MRAENGAGSARAEAKVPDINAGGAIPIDRRALGRALTRAADASVESILAEERPAPGHQARRIGVTGPPGAGKSTLIAGLARHRLAHADRVAIVAIDPTSPKSRGSVLGDRVRMDGLIGDPRIYIRSLASRSANDGLAENLPEILAVLDEFGFDEIILETVGVGQSEFAVRDLVDIELLVMTPGAGDHVQAMKAGIIETADIYVINKCDQPGASRMEADLRRTLSLTATAEISPILQLRADAGENIASLNEAIEACFAHRHDLQETGRKRARSRIRGLVLRRFHQVMDDLDEDIFDGPVRHAYDAVVEALPHGGPEIN
jgi:LAO/AO transport system kinase